MSEIDNNFELNKVQSEMHEEFENQQLEPINHCGSGSCSTNGGNGCEKKKCKSPMIAAILIVVVVLVAGGLYFYRTAFGNPVDKLLAGFGKLYSQKEIHSVTDFSFEVDKNNKELKNSFLAMPTSGLESSNEQVFNFFSEVLPKFKFKYVTGAVEKDDNIEVDFTFDVLYKDASLMDFLFLFKFWETRVGSKQLFSKPFYVDIAKLVKDNTSGAIDLSKIHVGEYLKVLREQDEFTKTLGTSEYSKILKEFLKDKVKEEGSKLVLTYKQIDTLELVRKFVKVAKTDEKLKKYLINKVNKLIDTVTVTKDYEAFGMPKEQFEMMAMFTKNQFENGYAEMLNEMERTYDSEAYKEAMNRVSNGVAQYTFTMKDSVITEVEARSQMNGLTFIAKSVLTGRDAYLKEVSEKPISELSDLSSFNIDPFGLLTYVAEIGTNFENNVLKGKAFKEMAEDIKGLAKTHLAPGDATKIQDVFDNMIPNALNQGLRNLMGGF